MEERKLDWSAAEVADRRLTVPLTEEAEEAWTAEFAWVAERLSGGNSATWGKVKASKKKVTVEGVEPGSEGDLRHFLESVVQQVNADQAESHGGDGGEGEDDDSRDRQMTETFRSFADGDGERTASE